MTLLGWDLIVQTLESLAFSPVTQAQCGNLVPENDLDSSRRALEETAEMVSLMESLEAPPMASFEDARAILKEAEESFLIEPVQGLQVLKLLRLVRSLRRYLEKRTNVPLLKAKSERLDPLPSLLRELERCIDDDGEIRETASPELREAIREVWSAKEKLESAVAKILADSAYADAIQDSYHTEREGRVVIPVKAECRSRVDGIVHDTSGSGVTVYMEPTRIVQWNNQLKLARIRVEREKLKILGQLAKELAANRAALLQNLEILADLDLIHAKARLARLMDARKCPITQDRRVDIRRARNPELVLNRREVVPNDIAWDPAVRVIVISGPNTGGKTVTLKTVGLMSLMVRAGLFLPVGEDSVIGFFPEVHADIGDEQNIQLNLSTFSAHLRKIVHILDNAAPGALVLLDELGIATDPLEGAALAEAILLEMKRKGLTTIVSTHYLSLKILAQTEEGFLNACAEFNPQTLRPTYRLIFGAPGNSAALETAERLGLPPQIIERARAIYAEKDHQADALLQKLNQQALSLAQEKEALRSEKEETRKLQEEQALLARRMREDMLEFNKSKAKQLQTLAREGKQEIRRLIDEVKGSKNLPALRKAQAQIQSLERVAAASPSRVEDGWDVPPDRLKSGDPVMVDAYGARGTLMEDAGGKKKVRVRLGNTIAVVETGRLRGNSRPGHSKPAAPPKVTVDVEPVSQPRNACDLRGLRLDEAKSAVEAFVSQAIVNKVGRIRIVHGHGMGSLKKMVRDYLETTGLGKSYGPGAREEGGDGVTVVEL